jgi:hypothetical protein
MRSGIGNESSCTRSRPTEIFRPKQYSFETPSKAEDEAKAPFSLPLGLIPRYISLVDETFNLVRMNHARTPPYQQKTELRGMFLSKPSQQHSLAAMPLIPYYAFHPGGYRYIKAQALYHLES